MDIDKKVTVLIGANESGKTNFLHALRCFSSDIDFQPEDTSKAKRTRYVKKEPPSISFTFSLSDKEKKNIFSQLQSPDEWSYIKIKKSKNGLEGYSLYIPFENISVLKNKKNQLEKEIETDSKKINEYNEIIEKLKTNHDNIDNDIKNINEKSEINIEDINKMNKQKETILKDIEKNNLMINDLNYKLQNNKNNLEKIDEKISNFKEEKIETNIEQNKNILNGLPRIMYCKQLDLIPEKINMNELLQGQTPSAKLILNLLRIGEIDDPNILNDSPRRIMSHLQYASGVISAKLADIYNQEKLQINLTKETNDLIISIQEKISLSSSPQERSEGFQWFLSFFANFMSEAEEEEKKIILLDEPAILLHPKGQKDFLKIIEEMSKQNQIIYTSHTPFLINKNYPQRIRLLEKTPDKGTIIINKPYSDGKSRFWEPLKSSIGITLGDLFSLGETNLIVEGISDQILLAGISIKISNINDCFLNLEKITIVPAMGASSALYLGLFAISESLKTIILVDNDDEGKKVIKKAKEEKYKLNILSVNEFKEDALTIEDLIPKNDYIKSVNSFYNKINKKYENLDLESSNDEGILKIVNDHLAKNDLSIDKTSIIKELLDNTDINENNLAEYEGFMKLYKKINEFSE